MYVSYLPFRRTLYYLEWICFVLFSLLWSNNGRLKLKVAPFPSILFSAHILPPWASIILLEINNPNPVPVEDFEVNFVNNRGIISGSIPLPVSFTLTMAQLSFFFFISTDTVPPPPPPSLVNLVALSIKLEII